MAHPGGQQGKRTTQSAAGLEPFRLLSWNILASVHTHHNRTAHQSGRADGLETDGQRSARHQRIASRLRAEVADILLLQEVDITFLPSEWTQGVLPCGIGLPNYLPYRMYLPDKKEGTAVLLRTGVFERAPLAPVRITGKQLLKKTGLVVFAQRTGFPNQRVGVASVHLKFGVPEQHMHMLRAVLYALAHGQAWQPSALREHLEDQDFAMVDPPVAPAAVIAGDFNTCDRDGLEAYVTYLNQHGFRRVPQTDGASTALGSDMAYAQNKVIDYIFVRGLVPLSPAQVGALPHGGRGPYGVDAVDLDGSDHAWLACGFCSPGL